MSVREAMQRFGSTSSSDEMNSPPWYGGTPSPPPPSSMKRLRLLRAKEAIRDYQRENMDLKAYVHELEIREELMREQQQQQLFGGDANNNNNNNFADLHSPPIGLAASSESMHAHGVPAAASSSSSSSSSVPREAASAAVMGAVSDQQQPAEAGSTTVRGGDDEVVVGPPPPHHKQHDRAKVVTPVAPPRLSSTPRQPQQQHQQNTGSGARFPRRALPPTHQMSASPLAVLDMTSDGDDEHVHHNGLVDDEDLSPLALVDALGVGGGDMGDTASSSPGDKKKKGDVDVADDLAEAGSTTPRKRAAIMAAAAEHRRSEHEERRRQELENNFHRLLEDNTRLRARLSHKESVINILTAEDEAPRSPSPSLQRPSAAAGSESIGPAGRSGDTVTTALLDTALRDLQAEFAELLTVSVGAARRRRIHSDDGSPTTLPRGATAASSFPPGGAHSKKERKKKANDEKATRQAAVAAAEEEEKRIAEVRMRASSVLERVGLSPFLPPPVEPAAAADDTSNLYGGDSHRASVAEGAAVVGTDDDDDDDDEEEEEDRGGEAREEISPKHPGIMLVQPEENEDELQMARAAFLREVKRKAMAADPTMQLFRRGVVHQRRHHGLRPPTVVQPDQQHLSPVDRSHSKGSIRSARSYHSQQSGLHSSQPSAAFGDSEPARSEHGSTFLAASERSNSHRGSPVAAAQSERGGEQSSRKGNQPPSPRTTPDVSAFDESQNAPTGAAALSPGIRKINFSPLLTEAVLSRQQQPRAEPYPEQPDSPPPPAEASAAQSVDSRVASSSRTSQQLQSQEVLPRDSTSAVKPLKKKNRTSNTTRDEDGASTVGGATPFNLTAEASLASLLQSRPPRAGGADAVDPATTRSGQPPPRRHLKPMAEGTAPNFADPCVMKPMATGMVRRLSKQSTQSDSQRGVAPLHQRINSSRSMLSHMQQQRQQMPVHDAVSGGDGESPGEKEEGCAHPSLGDEHSSVLSTAAGTEEGGNIEEGGMSATMIQKQRRRKKIERIASTYTFTSESYFVTIMDLLYIAISTVMCIHVMTQLHPKSSSAMKATPDSTTISILLCGEIFSVFWAIMRSRVRTTKREWEVIDSAEQIRTHYFKRHLWMDAILCFPLEFIFIVWFNAAFYIVACRHLLRLYRMTALNRSTNPLLKSRLWFQFVFFFTIVVIVCHVLALIFWAAEVDDYNTSIYWTITTLSSVGYGDVIPTSGSNRMFAAFTMGAGILLVSTLTAVGTKFMTERDPLEVELQTRKRMMYSMLMYYEIPWEVQKEVIALFPTVLNAHSEGQFKEVIDTMPLYISEKIDGFLRAKMLRKVPLFDDLLKDGLLNDAAILALTERLVQQFAAPFEHITVAGDMGTQMFFLVKGIVEILVPVDEEEERVLSTLRGGSWFGELALLEEGPRMASVMAVTRCELFVLSKWDFDSVKEEYLSNPNYTP